MQSKILNSGGLLRIWYYPWFHAQAEGGGMYPPHPWVREGLLYLGSFIMLQCLVTMSKYCCHSHTLNLCSYYKFQIELTDP